MKALFSRRGTEANLYQQKLAKNWMIDANEIPPSILQEKKSWFALLERCLQDTKGNIYHKLTVVNLIAKIANVEGSINEDVSELIAFSLGKMEKIENLHEFIVFSLVKIEDAIEFDGVDVIKVFAAISPMLEGDSVSAALKTVIICP